MDDADIDPPARGGIGAALLGQCYRRLPIGLAVNLINGLLLATALWGSFDASLILLWIGVLLAVALWRYQGLWAYRSAARDEAYEVAPWVRRYVLGAAAAGLAWGLAAVLLFHPESLPHQMLLAFLLAGMMAGGLPLLSAVRHAYPLFALPMALPMIMQMLFAGDRIHLFMALMTAVFALAMLVASRQVNQLYRDAEDLRAELSSSIGVSHALERLVRMDALTGIPNRRLFEEALRREWGRAEREDGVLALVSADIDHFKEYNDRYGHPAGDQCLAAVANAMQDVLARPGDVVARIGGEEFVFLLPGTSAEGARAVAEQAREHILALALPHGASSAHQIVTVSFGIASSDLEGVSTSADLVHASDKALYEAKRRGRNRVVVVGR